MTPSLRTTSAPSATRRLRCGTAALRVVAALALSLAARTVPAADTPLTPAESVAIAFRNSPQARAAWYQREAARAEADRNKPGAKPTLEAVGSGTVQGPGASFPRPDGDLATVLPEEAGRLDLIFDQPIYHAGAQAARTRYQAQYSAADLEYRRALLDMAVSVREAYIDVLQAESGTVDATHGLEAAAAYATLVRRQVDAGLAKPVDVTTVAAQVAEAQAEVDHTTGALAIARYAFNRALGRTITAPVSLAPIPAPPEAPATADAAVERAIGHRPELLLLQAQLEAAKAGVKLAATESQPTISVRGQLTEQTPTGFLREHYAALTLQVRWPLLDGEKTRLDTREAHAEAGRVEALLEDARQGIALDVQHAWQRMRDAHAAITTADVQLSSSRATEVVAVKAYEVGRGTVVEVQVARRETRMAEEKLRRATYDLDAAFADFEHAQGVIPSGAAPAGNKSASEPGAPVTLGKPRTGGRR